MGSRLHPLLLSLPAAVLAGVLLGSCLPPPSTPVNQAFRTICVYKIYNDTSEESIPSVLQERIIDGFSRDGRIIPVTDVEKADGLLALKVQKYFKDTLTWNPQMLPDRIHIGISVKLVLQNLATRQVLRQTVVEDSTNFNLFTEPISTEVEARRDLLEDMANRIVTITIEGFE